MLREGTLDRTAAPSAPPGVAPAHAAAGRYSSAELVERTLGRDRITALTGILLPVMALVATACWLVLLQWFDLREKIQIRYYAFEKVPGRFDSAIMHRTLAIFLCAGLLYIGSAMLIARARQLTPSIKLGALVFMAGPAVVNLFLYPAGALDVFNYMVDLKLAYYFDANPYVVTNPAFLHDDTIVRSAFLLNVPLFYGPAWLLLSGLPGIVTGYESVANLLLGLKLLNLVMLAGTALLISRVQPTQRRRWLAPFLFLANPLVIFEGIGNAHNDVMMTLFCVAAIYAMRQSRTGWLAAPALACSVLVKLFTGVLAPLFVLDALRERWSFRKVALAVVATAAITIAVVAPFWDGGDLWTGMREGTRLGQRMDHVSLLSLAQQQRKEEYVAAVPYRRYLRPYASSEVLPQAEQDMLHREFTVGFLVLATFVLAVRFKQWVSFERAAALILILFVLLMTNLYPWYLIPIFALLALEGEALGIAFVFVATLLGLAYYPAYVWAHFNTELPLFQVHLYLAIFLTAPMVAFLLLDFIRIGRRATLTRRISIRPLAESRNMS